MTIENAIQICKDTGLNDWELVAFAQSLVNQNIKYSITNSFDTPEEAFEKGKGYCWHQAKVLNKILIDLGFSSRLVHAYKNYFPEVEFEGIVLKDFVTGHLWCRVTIGTEEKDVCPGNIKNKPGITQFKSLGKVHEWNSRMDLLTYYGAALVNFMRGKKYINNKNLEK